MGAARIAVAFGIVAALVAPGGARADRLPFQADVDICAQRAVELGDSALSGSVRLELLVRADGKVYAAYAHSAKGMDDKVFFICLTSNALLWQYPPVSGGLDTRGPFPLTVTPGGANTGSAHSQQVAPEVFLPSARPEVEPADLDAKMAQTSLNLLDDATLAERGQAMLAVQKYPDALQAFHDALEKDPNDRIALRGLAQALAESGGSLADARAAAAKLIGVAPDSEVGPEAMLRVCAAAKDDLCVFNAWRQLRTMRDAEARNRLIREELQPMAEKSAQRLRMHEAEKKTQAAAEASDAGVEDSCGGEASESLVALCEVKRCLDNGSAIYAQELSQGGEVFEVSDWRFREAGKDRLLVTRPISSRVREGKPVEHRDAIFLVKIGQSFSIQASNAEAKAIAVKHNACAPAAAAAPASGASDAGTSDGGAAK